MEDQHIRIFETFRPVHGWEERQLTRAAPACVNGHVTVRKYRVTIELVEEPEAVIQDRILALWQASQNPQDWEPLQQAARQYHLTLPDRYAISTKEPS